MKLIDINAEIIIIWNNYTPKLNDINNTKNEKKIPQTPGPPEQISIAGGFFLLHKKNIWWWKTTFDKKLELYFKNDYLLVLRKIFKKLLIIVVLKWVTNWNVVVNII